MLHPGLEGLEVTTYPHGKLLFLSRVFDRLRIPEVIDKRLTAVNGRPPCTPYGVLAKLLLINLCTDHHPLYRLSEYYLDTDLEMLFGRPLNLDQLYDTRFGYFLDRMFLAEPRRIFTELAVHAFTVYGIKVRTVNFDTTSKIMWGEYESEDGTIGAISICLGHSKQKRGDKNQLKIAIGTANGAVVDAQVLSGNLDDKKYNFQQLNEVTQLLERFHVDKEDFYYIADAALFTKDNIQKAQKRKLKFITRAPESINLVKELIEQAWEARKSFRRVEFQNAHGKHVPYDIQEAHNTYQGIDCQFTVCYSPSLEEQKRKTMERQGAKELEELQKLAKTYQQKKRTFSSSEDVEGEIALLRRGQIKRVRYHEVSFSILPEEIRRRGHPRKNLPDHERRYRYRLVVSIQRKDDSTLNEQLKRAATFVLASNDITLSGAKMLEEYRTQSSVEKKFQQLKSPVLVNSIFLNTAHRIEAFVYLMLIAMMALSVIELAVRYRMKSENAVIVGPGKVRMTSPSLRAIVGIFHSATTCKVSCKGGTERHLIRELTESQKLVLQYLGIGEDELVTPP